MKGYKIILDLILLIFVIFLFRWCVSSHNNTEMINEIKKQNNEIENRIKKSDSLINQYKDSIIFLNKEIGKIKRPVKHNFSNKTDRELKSIILRNAKIN